MTHPLIGDITNECIDFIYHETQKTKNKKKLKNIMNIILDVLFSDIKPYLYTILGILVLIFLINFVQFYYYIKMFTNSGNTIKDLMSNI